MEINDDRIWLLITRVLSGEASISEKEELEEWISEKPEHQNLFDELEGSWHQDSRDLSFLFDYQKGLGKLKNKINQAEEKNKTIANSKHGSGSQSVGELKPLKIAASILLLVSALAIVFTMQYWEPSKTIYTTSSAEQRILTLPDGSKVRLNSSSQITFNKNFEGGRRDVELQGEAFFEVEKNPGKPFVIHVDKARVEVLGTAFSVKEQSSSPDVMVVVKEGVVSFRPEMEVENKSVKLRKGYLGYLSGSDGNIDIEKVQVGNYFSWMDGNLSFDATALGDVLKQLERIYGIENIITDSSLSSQKLTAHTNSASLHEVLKMIAVSLDVSYSRDGDTVTWVRKHDSNLER